MPLLKRDPSTRIIEYTANIARPLYTDQAALAQGTSASTTAMENGDEEWKHEAKCIDIVVKEIHSKLPHTISSEDEPLVGMKCRIEEGTKNIEGILMHPQCELKHTDIAIEAFKDMQKLRLLEVHNVCTPRVPEYLPSQLRWLIWEEFPSKSLPPRFEANNLVGLQLHCSSIERPWRGEKQFYKIQGVEQIVNLRWGRPRSN
ncbi:hypothetical protein LguiB_036399 [Lonicera macranthoides]